MVVMASGRLRGRGFDSPIGTFFPTPFLSFFFLGMLLSHFSPLFFLRARSAISMLKHFSSIMCRCNSLFKGLCRGGTGLS